MSNETEKKEDNSEDGISLIDLFAIIWHQKIMIIAITVAGAIGAVVFSVISLALPPESSPLPNLYTPKALMLIENRSAGSGLSSMMGNMGGLAAMAGIRMPAGSSYSELAIFLTGTNTFLDAVVDEFNLIEKHKIQKSPRTSSRRALKNKLKATVSEKSSILTISFTDINPVFARDVVNFCTNLLAKRFDDLGFDKHQIEKENLEINIESTFEEIIRLEEETRRLEHSVSTAGYYGRIPVITMDLNRIQMELTAKRQVYTQLKVQYELLLVEMASEKPIFQILEMAEVPDQKSAPGRGMICIIVTLAAAFFAVFMAFVLNFIGNIRKDPEIMAKLRGINVN